MQMTQEEIIREFERLFPLEFRVTMLTLTNRKQSDMINQQETELEDMRKSKPGPEDTEFWKGSDKRVPLRPETDPGKS